jgi:hypothetical protein
MPQNPEGMPRRSDYGQVRATDRDLYLLKWIGEQYAVRVDQLKELAEVYKGSGLSVPTIKWLTGRWRDAGWVEKQVLLAGQPQWVWLSREGYKDAGLEYPYARPSVSRLKHIYHTNAVRLWIEKRSRGEAEWTSDRSINPERKLEGKRHFVDGEVFYEDKRIALEVELTQKSRPRLDSILRELKKDYEAVWYFASIECYTAVKNAIESVPGHQEIFVLYHLENVFEGG